MKTSEIEIGTKVVLSDHVAAKHLNVIDDEEADLEAAERFSGLSAITLLLHGRREWLIRRLRKPITGTILEVGLPWMGRKTGVLVGIDIPAKDLFILGLSDLKALVPASMVFDYWNRLAELEVEKTAFHDRMLEISAKFKAKQA